MSADGNVKFSFTPLFPVSVKKPSASVTTSSQNERICGYCEQPLAGQPPVLLKSRRSLHLECYLTMRKAAPKGSTIGKRRGN